MNKTMDVHKQFTRYMVVGLASNAIGYVIYLILTRVGLGPKLAMSLIYGISVLQTFVFNKNWSFRFTGAITPALVRYATVYALGYLINFLALLLLVDEAALPHQWVMAGLILFMAVFFFAGQKFWVFRHTPTAELRG